MLDLIIIGGGPAGLTAAVYAIQKRLEVLLISPDLGGKTNYRLSLEWVEDYEVIRGTEVVDKFRRQIEYLEFARFMDLAVRVEPVGKGFAVLTKGGERFEGRAVLVATGARPQQLGVPGEREYLMKGLCYSAVSYAPLFLGRRVAVIGEGDLALRSAAELAEVASQVFLIGVEDQNLTGPLGHKLREMGHVIIMDTYQVLAVKGDKFARALVLRKDGAEQELRVDGTFVELDLVPNSEAVAGLVACDSRGRILVDSRNRTSYAGVFAAGDVTDIYAEQVLIAVGEGAKAALGAYDYLLGQ